MGDRSNKRPSHYDRLYAAGGFDYERDRERWRSWVQQHYVERFDLLAKKKRTVRALLRSALAVTSKREPSKRRVLDIPCGDGFWSSVFAELGFEVTGIDISSGGVESARSTYPEITFLLGDAEWDLPVEVGSFDVVFSRGITHLHRDNLNAPGAVRVATNLMRYAKPEGGVLLISYFTKRTGGGTPHHRYHPVSDLVRLFERGGDVRAVDVVGDFVQLGVYNRPSPKDDA